LLFGLTSVVAVTVAVLSSPLAQSPATVVVLTLIDLVVPAAIVPYAHDRLLPVMVQLAASGPLTIHVWLAGSASLSITFAELPVPPAVTVMLYIAWSPTATAGVDVVLLTDTSGAGRPGHEPPKTPEVELFGLCSRMLPPPSW
jgi:hypothetical protein